MPIKRYLWSLKRSGELEAYMTLLINSFNPSTAYEVMCTNIASISWDGYIYDCDFNQMLDIPIGYTPKSIWEISDFSQLSEKIAFADHCYGCTAGFWQLLYRELDTTKPATKKPHKTVGKESPHKGYTIIER